jgi:hypothetical protein
VPLQHSSRFLLNPVTHVTRTEGTIGIHQNHTAGFGETRLAATAFAIDQFQQFVTENAVAKEIGKAGDGLFDGANAAHHFGALLQELAQLIVSLPHNLFYVSISAIGDGSHRVSHLMHKSSDYAPVLTGNIFYFPYTQELMQMFPSSSSRAPLETRPLQVGRLRLKLVNNL